MSEKLSQSEFMTRVIAVGVGCIIVLFAAKIFIVDALQKPAAAPVKTQFVSTNKPFPKKENITIKWQDAAEYVGQYVKTSGDIVSAYNTGKVCFLNFHKDYRNYLALVIFASDYKKFPESPEKYFLGKKINVEGRIKLYNERTEIIVKSMDQIKIINKD